METLVVKPESTSAQKFQSLIGLVINGNETRALLQGKVNVSIPHRVSY